jgi:uncharacterized protein (TIGR04255 family)
LLAVVEDASAPRHYNRAPIVEATLGVYVAPLDEGQAALLDEVRRALEGDYPTPLTSEDEPADAKEGVYVLKSANDGYVLRFSKDRFSLSRLEPYDRWEPFRDEFRRTWSVFEAIVHPTQLTHLWVRYINKLRVPFERPLHEFFNVYPGWPDRDTLFTRMFLLAEASIQQPPGALTVHMYPAMDEADKEAGFFPMVLGNTFTFNIETPDAMWRNLDDVRRVKNETFESQLTDAMKETIS